MKKERPIKITKSVIKDLNSYLEELTSQYDGDFLEEYNKPYERGFLLGRKWLLDDIKQILTPN